MAASSGIILPGQTNAATTTPASGGATVYMNSTHSQPEWKDNSGNSHAFGGGVFLNVVDYGADPTGATDSAAAVNLAITAATFASGTGSIIYFPQGTYLIGSTLTAASYYYTFMGSGNPSTTIISTSQTGDLFAVNQWYMTVKDMLITAPATTLNQVGVTLSTTPQTLTINTITLAQWSSTGSFQVGTTAGGWVTASYTGRTTTTLTGVTVAAGTNALTTGAPIQYKTGGYAVNISNGQNYCQLNNAWITNFYQGVNQGGSTNSMQDLQIRNSSNVAIVVNNVNAQVYLHNVTTDNTATNQPATANLQVLICGLLVISDCDFIHGGATNCLMNSTGAGIFSVYVANTFFDTSSGANLSIQGSTTMRSLKFVNCWFSSATNGIILNNAACSGLNFTGCDIYTNSGTAIIMTACADWSISDSRIASPSAGTQTGITLAGSPTTAKVAIVNCTIGTVGAFFSFATGLSIAAGTYGQIRVIGSDLSSNTTPLTDSSTTVTSKIFNKSPGINPRVAVTPAVPATGVAITNTTGVDVTAYIKGGTLTAITVGGTATGIAIGSGATGLVSTVSVAANQTISITFTVAPTWVWIGS